MADQRATRLTVPPRVRSLARRNEQLREVLGRMESFGWERHPAGLVDCQRQLRQIDRQLNPRARWTAQLQRIERTRLRRPEWLDAIIDLQFDLDIDHPIEVANAMMLEGLLTLDEVATVFGGGWRRAVELLAQGRSAVGPEVELLRSTLTRCRYPAAGPVESPADGAPQRPGVEGD